ncbi:MAG: saccharopine dehydrogenase NADP-binding domain-containing protein [Spirochaetia bacterium]|nr:saccharopine dehydrogenase NADP-binding domain-containing protein [Spirochaetales bacterium]MBR4797035.1 saccharopine dehydrogenase NADP-binding domain-containing protein [Spirochaetia bacterium]MBR5914993.1 saccharopine dehydrogenase NADP-binding domain-containing protein [Spirochaetia bacterium]MBR5927055.1 saccharopine dehydrogenase NADP-binding domain-containing protein [Spirochaetia bacterium]
MGKKLFVLGAGNICGWSLRTVSKLTDKSLFEKITIGDINVEGANKLKDELKDPRIDVVKVDIVNDEAGAIEKIKGYDLVMDGTKISLNGISTRVILKAGCDGINLNGIGAEYQYSDGFKEIGKIMVPGFGMTPGMTDAMVQAGSKLLDKIDTVRISHCAYRPIAYSPSIFETTSMEYDPEDPGRMVYENGEYKHVPPFARERLIPSPAPYGVTPQYIIPHAETRTAKQWLCEIGKEPRLIEVRGTWPQKNMRLIKALYEWGIMMNDTFICDGKEMKIMDVLGQYLYQKEVGHVTDFYGYCLYIQMLGERDGKKYEEVYYHTHPSSDGSVPGWEGLNAYIRNVGTPMGAGAILIAQGKSHGTGCVVPEAAFDCEDVFRICEQTGIKVHHTEREIPDYNY